MSIFEEYGALKKKLGLKKKKKKKKDAEDHGLHCLPLTQQLLDTPTGTQMDFLIVKPSMVRHYSKIDSDKLTNFLGSSSNSYQDILLTRKKCGVFFLLRWFLSSSPIMPK